MYGHERFTDDAVTRSTCYQRAKHQ